MTTGTGRFIMIQQQCGMQHSIRPESKVRLVMNVMCREKKRTTIVKRGETEREREREILGVMSVTIPWDRRRAPN